MKKILVISLILAVFISCEKNDDRRISLSKDYFPLQVGNQWIFELAGKDSIISKVKVDGIDYYKFVSDFGVPSYYRKKDDRIFCKSSIANSKEEMIFDLAANVNETWAYGIGYVTLINRNSTITIGDVQIDSCLHFSFHNKDLIDYGYSIWLAPEIGIVQQTCQECFGSFNNTLKLTNARINNQIIDFN